MRMISRLIEIRFRTVQNWVVANRLHYWQTQFQTARRPVLDNLEKVVDLLDFIRYEQREHFVCITVDAANRVIARRVVSVGTLTSSLVHPREVFVDAITDRAVAIIVAHNHPGDSPPSQIDLDTTARLKEAGKLLGIELLDHLIISPKSYVSIL